MKIEIFFKDAIRLHTKTVHKTFYHLSKMKMFREVWLLDMRYTFYDVLKLLVVSIRINEYKYLGF